MNRSIVFKVGIPLVLIILLGFLANGFIIYEQNRETLEESVHKSLEDQVRSIIRNLEIMRQSVQKQVNGNQKVSNHLFYSGEPFNISDNEQISMVAIDQDSKEKHTVFLNKWYLGEVQIQNNFNFVDKIQSLVGGTVTIFQKIDKGFLRVSTNIIQKNGKRAIGTYIPNQSPVIKEIMAGKTYIGRAKIIDEWYITSYEPIKHNGKIVGILYVGVKEQNAEAIKNMILKMKIGKKGYAATSNEKGILLIHPTSLGMDISQETFFKEIITHKNGLVSYTWMGEHQVSAYAYYPGFRWYVMTTAYMGDFTDEILASNRNITLISTAIIVVISIVVILLLLWVFVIKPIRGINNILKDLAAGDGDLTVSLPEQRRDEIGRVATHFNAFIQKLYHIVLGISGEINGLIDSSQELGGSSQNLKHILNQVNDALKMTSEVTAALNKKSINAVNAMEDSLANVGEINSKAREIEGYYEALEENAGGLEDKVLSVTTAVEEMNATIGEITRNTTEAASVSGEANQQAEATRILMSRLSQMTNDISEIVDMIKEISAQTNLLALNATIEAASAGEAGKGFAVVANEIKNLANQTANATKKINDQIVEVQQHTDESVAKIGSIGEVITKLNYINLEIASALEEQSVTINMISGDMNVTATTTKSTVQNVREIGSRIKDIFTNLTQVNTHIEQVSEISKDVSDQVHNISDQGKMIGGLSRDAFDQSGIVSEAGDKLTQVADQIKSGVNQFKL